MPRKRAAISHPVSRGLSATGYRPRGRKTPSPAARAGPGAWALLGPPDASDATMASGEGAFPQMCQVHGFRCLRVLH